LKHESTKSHDYEAIDSDDQHNEDETLENEREHDRLLSSSVHSACGRSFPTVQEDGIVSALKGFKANLNRARGLFFP
jgi:battenin